MTPMLDSGKIAHRFRYALLALALLGMSTASFYMYWEVEFPIKGFLITFAIMLFMAFVFLGPRTNWPIRLAQQARPLKSSIAAGALVAAALTVGLVFTILEAISNYWDAFGDFITLPLFLLAVTLIWALWGFLFWLLVANTDRYTGLSRITKRLLAGSILELFASILVQAVLPDRHDCFCARGSYLGIIIGGLITFWIFGPALVLVFMYQRVRMARLDARKLCQGCQYDLTGTRAANLQTCPECGRPVPSLTPAP